METNGPTNTNKTAQNTAKLSNEEMIYLRRKFDEMDKNHDGGISQDELVSVLKDLGYKSNSIEKDAASLIGEMDLDASQNINFFEFAKGFEKLQMDIKGEEAQVTQNGGQPSAKLTFVTEIRKALKTTADHDNEDKLSEAKKKISVSQTRPSQVSTRSRRSQGETWWSKEQHNGR